MIEQTPNLSFEPLLNSVNRQLRLALQKPLNRGLYLVATPIGNLSDISLRGLATLSLCDTVLCEDTRHSRKLMEAYGIKAQLVALHDHNEEAQIAQIADQIKDGKSLALVSDAGTPLISDPGFKLVRALRDAEVYVSMIPGATAAIMALGLSGLPTDRFLFEGFLPAKQSARKARLEALKTADCPMIFYESPRRIMAMLEAAIDVFGAERTANMGRELTKLHEESVTGSLQILLDHLNLKLEAGGQIKGECVVVIDGGKKIAASDREIDAMLQEGFAQSLSLRDNVSQTMEAFHLARSKVYPRALKLKC